MMQRILLGWICFVLLACNDKKESSTTAEFPKVIDSNNTNQLPPVSFSPPDVSPMDMAYFPSDYPLLKMTGKTTTPPLARIIYSRPHKGGRSIFGNLIKYNEPWRLGANESTELELFSTATIQDKKIKPGKYILYCIPKDSIWTIVFNSDLYSWGLKQDESKDLYRFDASITNYSPPAEFFTINFKKTETGADLIFTWDNVKAVLPFRF